MRRKARPRIAILLLTAARRAELANLVGSNLFQARQEITKALSYVGDGGTVTREDVRLLCSQSREEDIF